jgi:hypothetical protein
MAIGSPGLTCIQVLRDSSPLAPFLPVSLNKVRGLLSDHIWGASGSVSFQVHPIIHTPSLPTYFYVDRLAGQRSNISVSPELGQAQVALLCKRLAPPSGHEEVCFPRLRSAGGPCRCAMSSVVLNTLEPVPEHSACLNHSLEKDPSAVVEFNDLRYYRLCILCVCQAKGEQYTN